MMYVSFSTAGSAGGLILGLAIWRLTSVGFMGVPIGLVITFATGVSAQLSRNPDEYSVANPRQILHSIRTVGLVTGLALGLAVGLSFWLMTGAGAGLAFGLAVGLALGPLGTFWEGFPVLRFIALLLCTRRWNDHWLPWRLENFLNWCYQAGLIRVAGIGYQLRPSGTAGLPCRQPNPAPVPLGHGPRVILAPPVGDSA